MSRFLLLAFVVIFYSGALQASINDGDIAAVGSFLKLDLASAQPEDHQQPSTRDFFVSQGEENDVVTEEDAKNAKQYYSATLPAGEYRQVWIINEVPRFGVVVRKAFLGPQGGAYWCDDLQSLAHFSFRAELGQRGCDRLLTLPVALIQKIFGQPRQGVVPAEPVAATEKKHHLDNMEVLFKVALFRAGDAVQPNESTTRPEPPK